MVVGGVAGETSESDVDESRSGSCRVYETVLRDDLKGVRRVGGVVWSDNSHGGRGRFVWGVDLSSAWDDDSLARLAVLGRGGVVVEAAGEGGTCATGSGEGDDD